MILGAKWIITGDGETVLENQAIRIDGMGKIAQIGQLDELKKHGREKKYRTSERRPSFRECAICIVIWVTGTASRIVLTTMIR